MPDIVIETHRTAGGWSELDLSILEEKRGPVPPFPLDVLPQPWRDWVSDMASSAGAPADYIVQSLLAALAGICGAGVSVRVTPAWSEPMVLWQAVVGEPSTGKSAALAPMRRLLGAVEEERRALDGERREIHAEQAKKSGVSEAFVPSQIVAAQLDLADIGRIVSGNPRGVIVWRDVPSTWIGDASDDAEERAGWQQAWSTAPAVSILATLQPDRVAETLREDDDGIANRFLYVWPGPQPYRGLRALKIARDDEALNMLRRLSRLARTPADPLVLPFDERGIEAFDGFLAGLHAERCKAEGLEAAWLGKGPAIIARLAGALELLAWSSSGGAGLPGHIGREQVEAASRLWADYFRAHARAVFDRAVPSDFQRQVRRVARWLTECGADVVSREDIRRKALGQTVNANETDNVLYRLDFLGFVCSDRARDRAGPGRPANRWRINPALKNR
jgi:hypothetical protein